MTVEIKTIDFEPKRQTFGHVARRLGVDKPATRYQEAVMDVQATDNFHYKPLWEPDLWVYDKNKTKVVMDDWYKLLDPRQFYYATYNISRAGMNQSTEKNFSFVEDKELLLKLPQELKDTIINRLIPVRHVHWGANMNMSAICDRGYGTAFTSPCIFSVGDHLGMAQIIGRIGLDLDGQTGNGLDAAKEAWMSDPKWQGIRKLVEDTLVEKDFIELYVAQELGINSVVLDYVYNGQDDDFSEGALAVSMLTEFISDWAKDEAKWADATIKIIAAESLENKSIVSEWAEKWINAAAVALVPFAGEEKANAQADKVRAKAKKLGLEV